MNQLNPFPLFSFSFSSINVVCVDEILGHNLDGSIAKLAFVSLIVVSLGRGRVSRDFDSCSRQRFSICYCTQRLIKTLPTLTSVCVSLFHPGSLDPQLLIEQLQLAGVYVHFLELAKTDIRADLVILRNRGIGNFIIDVGADLIPTFFDQVCLLFSL